MDFLKAEWKKLVLFNYEWNPDTLLQYLPKRTEIVLYEGKYYVSLFGFMFKKTKLLGASIPFHTPFEEINLRFYVKKKDNEG
jgi:uncharacterized protein YqjF (DUF2071 family)